MFKAAGVVSEDELMTGYRRFGQRLEGHPTPILPWVDVATGSLGQGLPDGVGVALAGRYLDRLPYRVWVLCGDSELAEGSIWEAFDKASYYQLSNLIAIVDINRLGQRGETDARLGLGRYARRVEAFGARTIEIDGHDLAAIDQAMTRRRDGAGGQPTVIIAKTIKGKGFSEVENKDGWHGKPFPPDMADRAIAELGGVRNLVLRGPRPEPAEPGPARQAGTVARRPAAGQAERSGAGVRGRREGRHQEGLRRRAGRARRARPAGWSRWTARSATRPSPTSSRRPTPSATSRCSSPSSSWWPRRPGWRVRGYKPFASTFAAFFTRAYDFIRMGAISGVDLRLAGSHAGVEIGADGPSQMALEDLAMMRAVHGSTVLYPSDGTSTAALVEAMAETPASATCAPPAAPTPASTRPGKSSPSAAPSCVRSERQRPGDPGRRRRDRCTRRCGGRVLRGEGIAARVIDLYSVKPVDTETLVAAAPATGGRIVVAEDHHPEGGLGAAVADALLGRRTAGPARLTRLAVSGMPGSGTGDELLAWAGIDADHIAAAARKLVDG